VRFYAIGLGAYAALKVLVSAFYAIDRRKTPMIVGFIAVALNLTLNGIFTWYLGWGHRGLALSTACIALSNFLILYVLMHRHLRRLETAALLRLVGKVLLASVALAAVCWASADYLLADWASMHFWPKLCYLVGTIAVAGLAFVACAAALGIDEIHLIVQAVRRRLRAG
jgi:putative peptidoglycan lipid II flippase